MSPSLSLTLSPLSHPLSLTLSLSLVDGLAIEGFEVLCCDRAVPLLFVCTSAVTSSCFPLRQPTSVRIEDLFPAYIKVLEQ